MDFKNLDLEEFEKWMSEIEPPYKLLITKVKGDTIILQRIEWSD